MKIKYSALVSDARGKLNGSVASKNRYGNYFRNKTTPVNRQTASQMQNRSIFGAISKLWGRLSESARKSWETLAHDHPYTDIFGDSRTLQGSAMFQSVNLNLHKAGLDFISSAKAPAEVGAQISLNVEAVQTDNVLTSFDIKVGFNENPTGNTMIAVYATDPVPNGRTFVKNNLRLIAVVPADDAELTTNTDLLLEYIAVHGDVIPEDTKISVRTAILDSVSGIQGPPFEKFSDISF